MKLKDLLDSINKIAEIKDISKPYICGGVPRDKVAGIIKNEINDLDITTGDSGVHNLASEFFYYFGKKFNIKSKKMSDGHTSIYFGDLKIDFSSNFVIPNIDNELLKLNIKNPTDIQKEMFSRDFTCNALLMDLDLKNIKDPTKLGFTDIKNKIIKTCLNPEIAFTSSPNRIVRSFYLSCKLDFDISQDILQWIINNKEVIRNISDNYLSKHIDKALSLNKDRLIHLLNKTDTWNYFPITSTLQPHYKNKVLVSLPKQAQFFTNFDLIDSKLGPGSGFYSRMQNYESISDFRKKRRNKRKKLFKNIINNLSK